MRGLLRAGRKAKAHEWPMRLDTLERQNAELRIRLRAAERLRGTLADAIYERDQALKARDNFYASRSPEAVERAEAAAVEAYQEYAAAHTTEHTSASHGDALCFAVRAALDATITYRRFQS